MASELHSAGMRTKRYRVTLTSAERADLQQLIGSGKAPARKLAHARILLKADASEAGENIIEVFKQHRASATAHHCKIVRSRKHQHYSGVFSIGLHLSTRDVIFFISNDMLVTPSFFEALLLVSSLSRDIGIVRGTSNYTDSHAEHQVEPKEPLKNYQELENFSRSVFAAG